MGIFSPSRQEKLRSHPIVPQPNWQRHMEQRVPEYDELIASALQIAGVSHNDVDIPAMRARVHAGTEAVLKGLSARLSSLPWQDVQIVLSRPDFSSALLRDYLSTCGASGAAAYNKLAELMTDGIAESLAEQVRKGSFAVLTDDPAQIARIIGAAGVNPPAGDPSVYLPDPGGDEGDLPQLGYNLMKACGLTILAFGQFPLEHLTGLLLQCAPAFRNTEVRPAGVGSIAGHDDKLWMGFEGPQGSLIAFFGIGGGDFVQNDVLKPVSTLPPHAQWGLGTIGAQVPGPAAQILAGARPVKLWNLTPFAAQRPADLGVPLPAGVAAGLYAHGWQSINEDGFQLDVALQRGGTQAVFFTPYDAESFAVIAPLEASINGGVPDVLRGRSFGRYHVDVVADTVALVDRIPAGSALADPAYITEAGRALTLYAEQQFAGAASEPPVEQPPSSPPRIVRAPETGVGRPRGDSMVKGANVSLTKQVSGLTAVTVGLGWDVNTLGGPDFDIDASAIACDEDRKVLSDNHFVFFNNLRSPEGTIIHRGDNTTGEGDGDDELIDVDLRATPPTISRIFFVVSIFEADERGWSFGHVRNAFIRVVDQSTGNELARFDLTDGAATETAMVFGELYRRADEWKFRAIGQGYESGLAGVARDFGVDVG